MIEIAGHIIHPRKVSYIGLVTQEFGSCVRPFFEVVIDGKTIMLEFESVELAVKARKLMACAPGLP